jgi:hypothetical protein
LPSELPHIPTPRIFIFNLITMQSALPDPVFLQTTPATLHSKRPPSPAVSDTHVFEKKADHEEEAPKRHSSDGWYIPHLRLVLHDLDGPGAEGIRRFLQSVDAQALLREAVLGVARRLYETPEKQSTTYVYITHPIPPSALSFPFLLSPTYPIRLKKEGKERKGNIYAYNTKTEREAGEGSKILPSTLHNSAVSRLPPAAAPRRPFICRAGTSNLSRRPRARERRSPG